MITRTLGSILRGRATPLQLMMATILGGMLGFMPGFAQAGGLIVCIVLLLLVLSANLGLALLTALLAKLLAWLILPFTFMVGTMLLDGPTQGFFRSMINAPVLALFGFEYYVTSGGLLLGLIFGIVVGLLVLRAVAATRRKLSELEENSERYQKWSRKGWVKWLLWLFVGSGQGKQTYAQILSRRYGNPIRWWGAGLAALVIVGLLLAKSLVSGPIIAKYLKAGLERANGATVDVENVDINLGEGRLTITGLAMADPKQLQTNLFSAGKIEGQLSTSNLLRKRLQMDKVIVSDGATGGQRKTPGRIVGSPPPPLPDDTQGGKTLEDYLADAEVWRARLSQARSWLEKLSKPKTDEAEAGKKPQESLKERLARMIQEDGYTRVRADHLIEGSPSFLLVELSALGVKAAQLPAGETLDITAQFLSTQPNLVAQPPQISVKSSRSTVDFYADFASVSAAKGANLLKLACKNLPADAIGKSLGGSNRPPIEGGTLDFSTQGSWRAGYVDLPLNVTLRDTLLSVAKGASHKVAKFDLPLGIKGALDSPRIFVDEKKLTQALVNALEDEAGKALQKATGGTGIKIPTSVPSKPEDVLDVLGGLGKRPATKPGRK